MDDKEMIQIASLDGVTVVSFGVASISSVTGLDEIIAELRALVTEKRPAKIVIDFCGVKFFSSQMLGLLVDLWRKVGNYGGAMRISGLNPQLGRVFKITNLDRIFKFYPDSEAAVKAMNG